MTEWAKMHDWNQWYLFEGIEPAPRAWIFLYSLFMRGMSQLRLLLFTLGAALLAGCNSNTKASANAEPQNSEVAANIQNVAPSPGESVIAPEIVQLRGLEVSGDIKSLTVSNADGEYHLACNRKARGCESPTPGKNYLMFNSRTHWKYPNAQSYIDLAFIQDWTVTYNQAENVGLVPEDNTEPGFHLGLYMLDSWRTFKR